MDPNFALTILEDTTEDNEDRIVAGYALQEWFAKGGFVPTKWATLSRDEAFKTVCDIIATLE